MTQAQATFTNKCRDTDGEIFSESCQIKPNLDYNHTFLNDLVHNEIPFGAK